MCVMVGRECMLPCLRARAPVSPPIADVLPTLTWQALWNLSLPLQWSTLSTSPSDHMYTQSLWISVTGASVYACAFFNDVCCRFVQTACVCAAAADMYLCLFFPPQLKGSVHPNWKKCTHGSLTSRLFWFYVKNFVSLYHKHSINKFMLKHSAAAASLPRNCVSITPNMPQTSLSTVFIGTISLGELKSNKNCLQ